MQRGSHWMERHNCSEWRIGMWRCSEGSIAALWDQRRRRNGWFQQQEILRSCALTCWCLIRCDFFSHIPVWRSVRTPWVLWGLRKGGVHADAIPSRHLPMSLPLLPGHLHAQSIYGNLIPSRPQSFCQNWLKLANGLQSYFLWDWEGTDGLALKGT